MRAHSLRLRLGMVTAMVATIPWSDPIQSGAASVLQKECESPCPTRFREILEFTAFMLGRLEAKRILELLCETI